MVRISDIIENFLKELIEETDGVVEIQRNELANYFNCVPSQINYVIDTRFTAEKGYIVQSRRGGGGYIKIKKININKSNYLMHIVNSIGNSITQQSAEAFIKNFLDYNAVTEREAKMMQIVVSDKVLNVPQPMRDALRANILKNMILSLI
ncbi:CtsR family transcriptional regulator [Petroclostridium xylanilyticum]|uniref:CtsR family transcriptional regulator n=1 Tax=Petroclostridium xylanilyticum TaxID=1792311 RepID=UPI000B993D40|nr:CtsR family transcriptional regulator [Petroclostridium xylanilyticum]